MSLLALPPLYAIIDAEALAAHRIDIDTFAASLRDAGVAMVQYRDKTGSPQQVLAAAARLRAIFARPGGGGPPLIMNDRADLAVLADFDGVHVGQGDLSPEDARRVVGPSKLVGISTHTEAQAREAAQSSADYIAFGPIFATQTKPDAEPIVALEGLRRARALTTKPLVAIGGITRENAASVFHAGADSIAVISALLSLEGDTAGHVRQMVETFPPARFAKV